MDNVSPHPRRIYFERLERSLQPGHRWLDLGCGHSLVPRWFPDQHEVEARLTAPVRHLVGLDLDLGALRANRACTYRLQGTVSALPFPRDSFDLVTSHMLFEHLPDPLTPLREIHGVLRPGGRLILLTPNLFDIVSLVAWVVPNRWHPALVSRLEGRAAEDVYPTYFAFNRRRQIERLLDTAGFVEARVEYLDDPESYDHLPLIGWIEFAWHRLARRLPPLRGTLLIEAVA
jgi:SAM-dependent methyltransferase